MRRIAACLVLSLLTALVCVGLASAASKGQTKSNGQANYVGKTKQHRKIHLAANTKQMRLKSFSIELHCHDGSLLVDQESGFEPSDLHAGKFHETQYGSTDTVSFSGRVKGSKVTGTVKVHDRLGKVKCVSPNVKFTAHSG